MATDKPPNQTGKAACKDGYRACKNVNGMWENTPHERVPLRAVTVRTTGPVRCHRPVATLLRPRGNVVMGPWQRCYGPVATLIWARGNVDMGPWQRTRPQTVSARCLMVSAMTYVRSSYTPLIHPVLLPVFHLHEGHEKRHPPAPEREQKGGDEEGNGRGEHVSRSGRWDS